ncbi:F0F1 ATP synthase subunit delta [Immundisolibacter cernigliae]|uniref:ATP synthase subunit delta n=1 Tax=Immundisolibacter cernigliae TaxID=1810504 RepID=A0A1B1YST0_9GAMM|nr:F0F1 ATP synthase subunit delta [Immundisolibacter cernigliae]ANX03805.1 ATP synthase F0F1 subunit delta [Immundisolibacter cernigliae]
MAELATIARPYAEALFRAADPAEAPSLVGPLQQLAQIASEPRLREFADNPKVSAGQVSELILGVLPAPLPAALQNLLQVVLENGRLGALGEIASQYQELVDARAGVSQAIVYSAFEISAAQLADITAALARRFGRRLDTRVVIEPELIGGVRVVVGDEVLDTSVRARLEQMRTALAA